jgi:hypothetical protein
MNRTLISNDDVRGVVDAVAEPHLGLIGPDEGCIAAVALNNENHITNKKDPPSLLI